MTDTIVARSTAPGVGAIAVVRLSGPQALAIAFSLSPGWRASGSPKARHCYRVRLVSPSDGSVLDDALVTFFRGPASYTGEDVVEFSCHGGLAVPRRVEGACVVAGARLAEPGEFTRRAWLNGKLDLLQVEAVADLVAASTPAQQDAALHQLDRGLSRRVAELREELVRLEAWLVQHIDFPEEDEAPLAVAAIADKASALRGAVAKLLATAPGGTLLKEGARVVLAGRPNAGKSSLFNALLGEERALVSEEAGTTRDAIEVSCAMAGYPIRLVDTAGLREGAGRVESMGIEVARRWLSFADLVLLCAEDGGWGAAEEAFVREIGEERVLRVGTKTDLVLGSEVGGSQGGVRVSVEDGTGLDALVAEVARRCFGGAMVAREDGDAVVTRERQAGALRVAADEVGRFAEALNSGVPAEVASVHLRAAAGALEEITGFVSSDEVLDRLFAEFCIGK